MKTTPSQGIINRPRSLIFLSILLLVLLSLSACGQAAETETETTTETSTDQKVEPVINGSKIKPQDAKERLDSNEAIILVDVRTKEEFDETHIPDAILLPLATLKNDAATLLPNLDATYFVYCRSGSRSADAVKIMLDLGYTSVFDLGGIINWPYEVNE
ncbi:MAG TPA: rhodanese-like domain-containing protein [Clostridiales bacterium UBA8960]|nr:rhodanese-like domain-containing protein [Clostridiales bacterium UBA8960]